MSNYYFDRLTPDKIQQAREHALKNISQERRRASALRAIAEKLPNAYVTKRIEDKLLNAIPGATRVYLRNPSYTCGNVSLGIYYESSRYDDSIEINLCPAENRRIDAESLIACADNVDKETDEQEAKLAHLEEAAAAYNRLADQYARIYNVLYAFLYSSIPNADYDLERKYRNEPFEDPTVPRKPLLLPVRPDGSYTLDEFAAAVSL